MQSRYLRAGSLFLATTFGLGLLFTPINVSHAAEGDSVELTGLNIAPVADSGGSLNQNHVVVLKGVFTNTTDKTISKLELNLVSTPAIRSRGELAELISDPKSATNLIDSDTSAVLRNIPSGTSKNWQITFIGEQIFGTNASGVYGIGVQPNTTNRDSATLTTTPWYFNADIKPTNVSLAVPLTTLNDHLANNKVQNQSSDLAEAARLTNLVLSQTDSKISWLQDASLRNWVNQLMLGSDSETLVSLNNALEGLSTTTDFLPYGHTDLMALSLANQQDDLVAAINLTRGSTGNRPVFYTPRGGSADRKTISFLNGQGIRTIVSNEFLRGSERETTSAVSTSASNPVIVQDLGASSCLVGKDQSELAFFKSLTCLKSEIGMITAESPQNARSIVLLAPTDWNISAERLSVLVSELSGHNWMQLVPLDLVAASEPSQNFVSTVDEFPTALSQQTIYQANVLRGDTEILASLFVDEQLASGFEAARILGFSDLWESSQAGAIYLAQNVALVDKYLKSVSIQASARITTPEETSEIPITIVNKSDRAVSVSVNLTSKATSRFSAQPSELIQIESGQRITVPVVITLVGAGFVDVQAQLIAPNGESFGEVENIQISSAAFSQFARTLVWGAFALLVLLALSNFIKRQRDRRSKTSPAS